MSDPLLKDFYMVGGTALSLFIGHRISIDIDLFTEKDFDSSLLLQNLQNLYSITTAKSITNGLFGFINDVKIDLIAHKYPLCKPIHIEEGIRMVSLEDLGAMKLHAIVNNGTRLKDFIDVYYLLEHLPLQVLLSGYESKYPGANVQLAKTALNYHQDVDFSIPIMVTHPPLNWGKIKNRLSEAIRQPLQTF